jgi:hypothetical protein
MLLMLIIIIIIIVCCGESRETCGNVSENPFKNSPSFQEMIFGCEGMGTAI